MPENTNTPEPDRAGSSAALPGTPDGTAPLRPETIVAAPSPAYGVGMLDLLTADEWHRLAVAAKIPPSEVEAAFVGAASPRIAALMAWVVPGLWIAEAAREAMARLDGLVLLHEAHTNTMGYRPTAGTFDAVVTRLLIDGPRPLHEGDL